MSLARSVVRCCWIGQNLSMNTPSEPTKPQVGQLAEQAARDFDYALDYFWKSNRLIGHETELEQEKLKYYRKDSAIKAWRWREESKKLQTIFPRLIAVGNLFNAASLFERYTLLLGRQLEKHHNLALDSAKGQGLTRLFNYLKALDILPDSVPLYAQVQAAFSIRNCLAHAGGLLRWSRNEKEIRRLCLTAEYLSPGDRARRDSLGCAFDEIEICQSDVGEELVITNKYSFVATSYLRDYFSVLCDVLSGRYKQ